MENIKLVQEVIKFIIQLLQCILIIVIIIIRSFIHSIMQVEIIYKFSYHRVLSLFLK